MKITRNNLENSIVELIVEETVENVAKNRSKAIKYLRDNSEIKGFRKGANVPDDIIVRQHWEEKVNQIAVDFSIDAMYRNALKTEKIMPVAQGEIKEIISQDPLTIKIHIEVFPDIVIDKKYKDIKLKKKKTTVKADEVKKAIEDIEKRFTKFEEVTDKRSKAKMGDRVTIDTEGFEDGKLLDNTSMKDYPLVLGSNILVPGFEESIVGSKLGDELEFPVEFPSDYHNGDFAGKKSTFKVKINKFEKAVKPEFTEEFIEQLRGQKLDFDGFKELIKSEIKDTKDSNARMEEEAELIEELLKISKVEVGASMIKEQIERMFSEIKQNMANDNVKMSDYLESLKMDEEQYKETNIKPHAIKRVQGELLLHKLAELEEVKVEDKEMQKEIDTIISKFQAEDVVSRLKELYVPGNKYYEELRQRMSYRKIIDSFFTA